MEMVNIEGTNVMSKIKVIKRKPKPKIKWWQFWKM